MIEKTTSILCRMGFHRWAVGQAPDGSSDRRCQRCGKKALFSRPALSLDDMVVGWAIAVTPRVVRDAEDLGLVISPKDRREHGDKGSLDRQLVDPRHVSM